MKDERDVIIASSFIPHPSSFIFRTFACHFERSEKSRFAQRDFSQNRSK